MHIFAIAVNLPRLSPARLVSAVGELVEEFGLDPATAWELGAANSPGASISAAGIHHGPSASPRRYIAREGQRITLFDGLPVDPTGVHVACDAAEIARGWNDWAGELEGQFCAARIDPGRGRAEVLLDTFGLVPVFVARREGGLLASNSVDAIRSLLELSAPDPLGVSSMVGLGWAASRHTLLRDVKALAGGARHELARGGVATRAHFGPQHIDRRKGPRRTVAELADHMASMTESAARRIEPVRCAITAGRDSRLMLALARARDLPVECYTVGTPTDPDVTWGRELASHFQLRHEVLVLRDQGDGAWTQQASRLIKQTDGLSDLRQVIDYMQPPRASTLGVRMSGLGGEIGRNGPYDNTIAAANVPLAGHLAGLQRRVLSMKADAFRSLMTPEAQTLLDRNTARFFDERRAEGWHVNEIADLFFAFERVGCHGATAPRRACAMDDFFSPFCSRGYAEHCLTMSSAERYVELPYHQLLWRLSPELAAFPFHEPLPAPRSRRAGMRAMRRVARVLADRRGIRPRATPTADESESPFLANWFERRRDLIGELFAHDGSPLWDLVSRSRVHALMRGEPHERRANLVGLLRVATVFWYFHGPPAG